MGISKTERAKENEMFQNEMIAKTHGANVTRELERQGVAAHIAEAMGRAAEAKKAKELNDWTVANVGLD